MRRRARGTAVARLQGDPGAPLFMLVAHKDLTARTLAVLGRTLADHDNFTLRFFFVFMTCCVYERNLPKCTAHPMQKPMRSWRTITRHGGSKGG